MLLVHQTGSVKVGEVIRYTLTYEPANDRILPSPSHLHIRIKNTSNIALRAAYLHGPYTFHVAAYPADFNPNQKVQHPRSQGIPQFEPNVKAGSHFNARLAVPEDIRVNNDSTSSQTSTNKRENRKSVTWIIEITSQIIFSSSAKVHFEVLVSRDEKTLDYAFHAVPGQHHGEPGKVEDHSQGRKKTQGAHPASPKGVYSKAIRLIVNDTVSLWDKPKLPEWEKSSEPPPRVSMSSRKESLNLERTRTIPKRKKKKIHLVILTHGLHSNLSADLLYLKESIDATAKKAREDRKGRRDRARGEKEGSSSSEDAATAPLSGGQEDLHGTHVDEDNDDEEVIVRGFGGNACKTENGIQYLGKKLARYVLELTYPDQPFLPLKKSMSKKIVDSFSTAKSTPQGVDKNADPGPPSHSGSTIHKTPKSAEELAYTFTSISFIGHSLGGLIQLYAIGYIQKHAPHFFEQIEPVNFVCMASPLLGLSNENPMYIKFALDFGLVGRTGQDLGLTWRAPTIAKSGWTAMMNGFSSSNDKEPEQEDPKAKPLLRILPTGPAHRVLKKFRNRTLYSNVVNDGIVPLRTSCLLFLDWQGLEKVEKARRDNGLIGTVAEWGWNEITGGAGSPNRSTLDLAYEESNNDLAPARTRDSHGADVPQPSENATNDQGENSAAKMPAHSQFPHTPHRRPSNDSGKSFIDEIWGWIRPSGKTTKTDLKMFQRSQTIMSNDDVPSTNTEASSSSPVSSSPPRNQANSRPLATRGDSIIDNPNAANAPPKTTIFESAGDILNPPIPPQNWIIDPSSRERTIFHDRVYHPEDIPPPPMATKSTFFGGSGSSADERPPLNSTQSSADTSNMRVEEKIARAYHKDLSWRKVLVRLEPDAHNNMIVRRMFANAYGWPVVKHLCDTHFGDTYSAQTRDEHEPAIDRAKEVEHPVSETGEKVFGQEKRKPPPLNDADMRERPDELGPLPNEASASTSRRPSLAPPEPSEGPKRNTSYSSMRQGTIRSNTDSDWDERFFGESEDDEDAGGPLQRFLNPAARAKQEAALRSAGHSRQTSKEHGTSPGESEEFLRAKPGAVEGHRGLMPMSVDPSLLGRPGSKGKGIAEPVSPTVRAAEAMTIQRGNEGQSDTVMGGLDHSGEGVTVRPILSGSGHIVAEPGSMLD